MDHLTLILYIPFVLKDINLHTKFQVATIIGTLKSKSYKSLNLSLTRYRITYICNYVQTYVTTYECTIICMTQTLYSAGNSQWPGGQMHLMFVWGHQKSPNYELRWPKLIFQAIVNEWDLQLTAILGHRNFRLFSFWATTLILGVSSTAI